MKLRRSFGATRLDSSFVLRLAACATLFAACNACARHVLVAERNGAAQPKTTIPTAAAPGGFYSTRFEREPSAAELTALGRTLFFDTSLSASGRMSCATCHDRAHAWGPPNGRAVQLGGAQLALPGMRTVPSLRYQQDTPPFTEHYVDDDGDDSADQGPAGGRDWDGRAESAHAQAAAPLLSPFEMANGDSIAVVAKLATSHSAPAFRAAFGPHVLTRPALAWNGLLMALEVFQQSPPDFYPYNSRYDDFLRGEPTLTAQERRGLSLFDDPGKGNCAQCHPSERRRGAFPQFTDRGFVALGVPRNPTIAANGDPAYHDLGLCGPLRTDLAARGEYCGLFKTPTLRNVALRTAFFHNGVFATLEDVLRFYQRRDTDPGAFYPRGAGGNVVKFDDLPPMYRANVTFDPPFTAGTRFGAAAEPRFTDAEAADIIAFLKTLTDRR